MNTFKVKMGDVAKFPNGVEVNYDESTGSLVVLHPSKVLTLRPTDTPAEQAMVLSKDIWLIGTGGSG